MNKTMKQFFKNNINFFVYLTFATVLELTSLFVMTKNLFLISPWLSLSIIGIIFSIHNLLKRRSFKNTFLTVCLCLQSIICLFCVILYENTGTLFDFSMLNLVSETTKFMGTTSINYPFIIFLFLFILFFTLLTSYLNRYSDKYYRCSFSLITSSICLFVFIISHISIIVIQNKNSEEKFMNSLYVDSNSKYVNLGGTGNFINELYKMSFFNNYNDLSVNEIEEYIYKDINTPSLHFGVSEGNNLVTILVESLEWFAFISDPTIYPNGANLNEETLDILYPNLRKFYNMSVVMENHYSQDKTDISEDEALLGIYPNSAYINYGFPTNNLMSSIANSIKLIDNDATTSFFHNNEKDFYNRINISKNLGYDNLYFIDDMTRYGVTNYMNPSSLSTSTEMNLDSEMLEKMKDKMFLTDKRFVTHITSLSMHGNYVYRANMKKWYDKLNTLNIHIENEYLKNYLVYVMDFDCALGIMLDDLQEKNLLENTTIVMFSDHNTYLSELTYYVKNIDRTEYSKSNYNELFRVPLMIYDSNFGHQTVNKFTTTYDITPTILDLFGINYYSNLYYGNAIFSDNESVLYSRAFDIFITDRLYFSNINNILYRKKSTTDEYIHAVEGKSLNLLKKIYYINHIFSYDLFKDPSVYTSNFLSIN